MAKCQNDQAEAITAKQKNYFKETNTNMASTTNDYKFVLAVDPGVTCTGISLLKYDIDYVELIDFAYIAEPQNMKGESDCARVFDLAQNILSLSLEMVTNNTTIHNWLLAIEVPYFNRKNPRALILQSRLLQGIEDVMVLSLRDASDFVIVEYNPTTIKKAISGSGKASKEEVKIGAIDKIKITKTRMQALDKMSKAASEAVFDAMAIGYTHIATELQGEWQ